MKIIFLDIDGVITSARTGWHNMDIYALAYLNWCCHVAGAKIVISSTWRYSYHLDFWQALFPDNLHQDFKTPDSQRIGNIYLGARRGSEIQSWLNEHPEISEYLIIDDDMDMLPEQLPNVVFTDPMDGMLFEHKELIRTKLGIKQNYKQHEALPAIHNFMFGFYNTKNNAHIYNLT